MSDTAQEQNVPETDASIPPEAIRCISGLIYQTLEPGTGNERPGPDDRVQVVYRGWTETGRLVATSGDSDAPKTLSMRGLSPGLVEALQLMTAGQKIRAWIPRTLSSQEQRGTTKEALMFDIALIGFTRMKERPSLPIELTSPRKEG